LNENVPHTLDWPPYSPDLNPVENIWKVLKEKVRHRLPNTIDEVKNFLYEEWESLDNRMVIETSKSFIKRTQECIKLRGGMTHY
jgi:transposase